MQLDGASIKLSISAEIGEDAAFVEPLICAASERAASRAYMSMFSGTGSKCSPTPIIACAPASTDVNTPAPNGAKNRYPRLVASVTFSVVTGTLVHVSLDLVPKTCERVGPQVCVPRAYATPGTDYRRPTMSFMSSVMPSMKARASESEPVAARRS